MPVAAAGRGGRGRCRHGSSLARKVPRRKRLHAKESAALRPAPRALSPRSPHEGRRDPGAGSTVRLSSAVDDRGGVHPYPDAGAARPRGCGRDPGHQACLRPLVRSGRVGERCAATSNWRRPTFSETNLRRPLSAGSQRRGAPSTRPRRFGRSCAEDARSRPGSRPRQGARDPGSSPAAPAHSQTPLPTPRTRAGRGEHSPARA